MIKKFFKSHPVHRDIVKHLDVIFLFRPVFFFAVWVMVCIGMLFAIQDLAGTIHEVWFDSFSFNTLLFFTGLTLFIGSLLIINQMDDIESDKKNKKLMLVDNKISISLASDIQRYSLYLSAVIICLSDFAILPFFFLIYYIWGVLYNDSRYNGKGRPIVGLAINALSGLVLILMGWAYVHDLNGSSYWPMMIDVDIFIKALPYILCYSAISILSTIPDKDGDKLIDKRTFSLEYGNSRSILISAVLVLAVIVISLWIGPTDTLIAHASVCSFPFFIYALFRGLEKDIVRAIRYPVFLLNFFTSIYFPYLSLAVVLVYFISKYYYWHRFDLHYPALAMD